jgi:hypothetical protein
MLETLIEPIGKWKRYMLDPDRSVGPTFFTVNRLGIDNFVANNLGVINVPRIMALLYDRRQSVIGVLLKLSNAKAW